MIEVYKSCIGLGYSFHGQFGYITSDANLDMHANPRQEHTYVIGDNGKLARG